MTRPKTDADMALDLARLAQLFLSYGKHGAADKLLNAAMALEANHPAVTRVRAFTAYKCGRYAEAAALARQARAAGTRDIATSDASRPGHPNSAGPTSAGPTSADLAAMGLSLVEAFSLMSLGRTTEAQQRYASLDATNPPSGLPGVAGLDVPTDNVADPRSDTPNPDGRPAARMNSA